MKIYVINLKRDVGKRERILSLCEQFGLDCEIFEAIDGREIDTQDKLNRLLFYPDTALTPGEFGCALSHLSLYMKMIQDNVRVALILEDDVSFDCQRQELMSILDYLERQADSRRSFIYLLNEGITYCPRRKIDENYMEGRYLEGNGTYGYVIDRDAAEKLFRFSLPLRFEADFWRAFFFTNDIDIYNISPAIVRNADIGRRKSVIEEDRSKQRKLRGRKQAFQFKLECKTFRYKCWNNVLFKLMRLLSRVS